MILTIAILSGLTGLGLFQQPATAQNFPANPARTFSHEGESASFKPYTRERKHSITALAISPDSSVMAASCMREAGVIFWDLKSGAELGRSPIEFWPSTLEFSADGSLLYGDQGLSIWDVKTRERIHRIKGPNFTRIRIILNGRFAVCAQSGGVGIWDLRRLIPLHMCKTAGKESRYNPTKLDVSPRGYRFAVVQRLAAKSEEVQVWETGTARKLFSFPSKSVSDLAFHPDGRRLMIVDRSSTEPITLVDAATGMVLRRYSLPQPGKDDRNGIVALSPNGRVAVVGYVNGAVRLWGIDDEKLIGEYSGHDASVTCVRFSRDGKNAYTGGRDGKIQMWEIPATFH